MARLPPCVPDYLYLVLRAGWTFTTGLVAAIKLRCPQLHRGVQADAIGLSMRTFSAGERAIGGASFLVEKHDITFRQRLSTAQLRGMAGKQIRSRVAAAIVETAVDNPLKQWSLGGAAACVKMQRRTVSRAKRCGRTNRAQRRLQEANAPHQGTKERIQRLPEPDFRCPLHERTPEPTETGEQFVPSWKLTDLFRKLALGKAAKPLQPFEPKPAREIREDLRALDRSPEWRAAELGEPDRDRRRPRLDAVRMLLRATGVHEHFPERRRVLADVIAACAAPIGRLLEAAKRVAANPNVASVGAVLATWEIGRWLRLVR